VELGDGCRFPAVYSRIHDFLEYDVILGSVHITGFPGMKGAYSHEDFSLLTPRQREDFLRSYFEQVHQVAEELDVDVLCHLTCPLRYMVGKYHLDVSLEPHMPRLIQIFQTLIRRGISLEVNCSSIETMGEPLPSFSLLSLYRSLGGERITLGSDAHCAAQASRHFPFVMGELKRLGFSSVLFYEKRKPHFMAL
jgi:histidinol-phosphatase (PHP family)